MAELTVLEKAYLEQLLDDEELAYLEYPDDEYGSGGDCSYQSATED